MWWKVGWWRALLNLLIKALFQKNVFGIYIRLDLENKGIGNMDLEERGIRTVF